MVASSRTSASSRISAAGRPGRGPAAPSGVPGVTPADLLVSRRPPAVSLQAPDRLSAAPEATPAGRALRLVVLTSITEDGVAVAATATAVLEREFGWSAEDLRAELERVGHRGETAVVHDLRVPLPQVSGAARDVTVAAVGAGSGQRRDLRRAGAALGRMLRPATPAEVVVLGLPPVETDAILALGVLVEGALLGSYQPLKLTGESDSTSPSPSRELVVLVEDPERRRGGAAPAKADRARAALEAAVDRAQVVARATWRARDLANLPSSVKDPEWVARAAALLADEAGLQLRVRGVEELEQEGFGGILAVGRGSVRPPRLVEVTYDPQPSARGRGGRRPRHLVLVGKGITFDTGGLSLKRPWDLMVAMKTDMAASGAVLAVLAALPALGVTDRVTGLLALAENMPGADAARPGDVITHFGGRTTEVLNTDAEGRLVLADAIAYAQAELAPDAVVDLATLTGAATVGLGRRHAPLYSTDTALGAELAAASERSGDQVWPMPLVEDYRPALDSDVADVANVSQDPTVMGGSITAALFLREFAAGAPWAHLDIAGTGRADGDEHEVAKGATGFGVRLLCEWLAPTGR